MKNFIIGISILILLFSCEQQTIEAIPTFSENNHVNVVVEIPAGTNKKIEYDYASKTFLVDQKDKKDRIIDFIGYPGNYGFIPGTHLSVEQGGDGDALDAIIIGKSMPTSTIMEVKPLAILKLSDDGQDDHKILCIPADKKYQTIKANNFNDLNFDYPAIKNILTLWFENYKGFGRIKTIDWLDEKHAMDEIKKWQRKP